MSRGNVQSTIQNLLATVSGLSISTVMLGEPENIPDMNLPIAVLRMQQPRYEPLTFGVGGMVKATYDADINMLLGPPDMSREDAETAQIDWTDRIRAAVFSDQSLNGKAWNAEFYEGADNLDNYRGTGQYPQLTFRVRVEELIAKNASAS